MIPKHELDKAISVARKYRIGKLYLIGSSLSKDIKAVKDYDFAVSGVPKGSFFKFYGELFGTLSKNVDLIDLSGKKRYLKTLSKKKAS